MTEIGQPERAWCYATVLAGQTFVFLGTTDERFRNGRNCGKFERHDRAFERDLQNFIHDFYEVYRKAREDFLRDVRQVLFIILRKYDRAEAHSVSSEKFFFHAADGENFSAQCDFAGHGEIATHGNARESADDGGANGDAGGGAVLGDGAFGHVHVNVDVAIEVFRQSERVRT